MKVSRGPSRRAVSPHVEWPFAQQCARAEDVGDLRDLLQIEIERLGFRYFCCCSHVRPDRPPQGAVSLQNYPKHWMEHYNRARLFERDPLFVIGRNFTLPFLWNDPRFVAMLESDQAAIMEAAAAHGLRHGATIPLHGPRRYSASCSIVADEPNIDPDRILLVQRYAAYAYEAACALVGPAEGRPRIALPRRERECMKLVAIGKDDETIALILGIQRETVRCYIEMAKKRLGVTKRSHAVAYAIYTQAINIEDLFGS